MVVALALLPVIVLVGCCVVLFLPVVRRKLRRWIRNRRGNPLIKVRRS